MDMYPINLLFALWGYMDRITGGRKSIPEALETRQAEKVS